ncbi:MAG TPA: hypothetical protein VIF40_12960 [Methylosinus sp.]|jgi:hypothetical protein|uniref:hypothetical protein n=1 Tax=Methylosinus sp. TaxID=427 RepID=UPI002F93AB7D
MDEALFEKDWETLKRLLLEQAQKDGVSPAVTDAILADAKPFARDLVAGKPPIYIILALCSRHFDEVIAPIVAAIRESDEAVKH